MGGRSTAQRARGHNESDQSATEGETRDPAVDDPEKRGAIDDSSEDRVHVAVGGKRLLPPVRWIGAAVLVAALALTGYQGWLLFQEHQQEVATQQALDAAKRFAVALTEIESNALDENVAEVLDGATGEFKDGYAESSAQLRQLLIDNKTAARGTFIDADVQSATTDRAVVLLFVDQSVSNAGPSEPRIDRSRIKMTIEKVATAGWSARSNCHSVAHCEVALATVDPYRVATASTPTERK